LSPAIPVSWPARGRVKRTPWLLGRFLIEFIFAAGAQPVLPTIPAPELVVTAQTGRRSRIRAVFRGSTMGTFQRSLATHGGPQRCKVVGEGLPGMRIGQEPCHRPPCSATDPPPLSKRVIGTARSCATTPGPGQKRRRRISEVRRASTPAQDSSRRGGRKDDASEPTSHRWDTCADMSQLSTTWMSGLRCLCSKRDRRRLAPTLADRPR